jgi:F-type H+-transporting ATPase subunit b
VIGRRAPGLAAWRPAGNGYAIMTVVALMMQAGGGRVGEIASTFGVDWPHLTAQIVSFGIVCALLYWLAYRPVLRMLDHRRQQITDGLANQEKINAALAEIETQRQATIAAAQAESTRLIAEAREIARRVGEQEVQRATATAQQIVLNAKDAAAREHSRMLAELRQEVGRLVVQTTAAVAGKVLTADDHRRLAEATARQLAS